MCRMTVGRIRLAVILLFCNKMTGLAVFFLQFGRFPVLTFVLAGIRIRYGKFVILFDNNGALVLKYGNYFALPRI